MYKVFERCKEHGFPFMSYLRKALYLGAKRRDLDRERQKVEPDIFSALRRQVN